MIKLVSWLFMVFSLSCGATPPTDLDTTFRFSDNPSQGALLQLLAKRSVVFHVHDEGTVSYRSRDEAVVANAYSEILKAQKISSKKISVSEEKKIKKQLKQLGISYGIWVKGEDRRVVWSNSEDQRVANVIKP
ncbi:hypothetical protein H8K35_14575 [Undibacterium sp. LX40W]|uniref:Uncharacterized protein n=1 Tax=Undibacterium nitidum TaxID=2762298 RepID=A0A923KUE8_9BURK|nr:MULTISPECIES: hypothetical protein [Undibacterium]MBC3882614.1 hypothetical protein [Undibacterium nitidum]MBC3892895.1 hypothetical protein [Undibacterium sp. LX40W]